MKELMKALKIIHTDFAASLKYGSEVVLKHIQVPEVSSLALLALATTVSGHP